MVYKPPKLDPEEHIREIEEDPLSRLVWFLSDVISAVRRYVVKDFRFGNSHDNQKTAPEIESCNSTKNICV